MLSYAELFGLIFVIFACLYAFEAIINRTFFNREEKLPYQVYGNFNPYRQSRFFIPSTMSNGGNHEHRN